MAVTSIPRAARERLLNDLHPAIREYIRAVDTLKVACDARDLAGMENAMAQVKEREAEYLAVVAQ